MEAWLGYGAVIGGTLLVSALVFKLIEDPVPTPEPSVVALRPIGVNPSACRMRMVAAGTEPSILVSEPQHMVMTELL